MSRYVPTGIAAVLLALLSAATAPAQREEGFRAGAARIDITPPMGQGIRMSGYAGRTAPAEGVQDKTYLRALVLDDGRARAVIVAVDVTSIAHDFWEEVAGRIETEAGIPSTHLFLAATHTHAAPSLALSADANEGQMEYTRDVAGKTVLVVQQAIERLQPALMGVDTGRADVNINRVARLPGGTYWLGKNPDGPSDKTVHVLRFATPGRVPIAALVNYGVHCTTLGSKNMHISGDLAGACSASIEQETGDDFVALWTSGAAGDQNPIYGGEDQYRWVTAMGEILALEAQRTMEGMRMTRHLSIRAAQRVVTCPGQRRVSGSGYSRDGVYEFEDAEPVDIRLSLLMLNQVALAGVSGEVLTMIGQRLKAESPFRQTIMITHCNGKSGYLADDAAFRILSYETVSSRVKPNYAEEAIIGGFLEMMDEL